MSELIEARPAGNADFSMPLAGRSAERSFSSTTDEALTRRYGKPARKHEELVYEFSRDPALLHQYHHIYQQEFRIVQNAKDYVHVDDEHDKRGQFLIARRGNLCIGGARMSVKTPRQPNPLPIEIDGFRIETYFPQLREKRYGQIGRLGMLTEFRNGDTTRMILKHCYRRALALGLDMIFATAPLVIARGHMKSAIHMGLQAKLHTDIELPKYPMCEELKFYLVSVIVDKAHASLPAAVSSDITAEHA